MGVVRCLAFRTILTHAFFGVRNSFLCHFAAWGRAPHRRRAGVPNTVLTLPPRGWLSCRPLPAFRPAGVHRKVESDQTRIYHQHQKARTERLQKLANAIDFLDEETLHKVQAWYSIQAWYSTAVPPDSWLVL